MSAFRRKPEVIKLANKSINIAALSLNQTDEEAIEFSNKSLFELLNPFNKYQKSITFHLVMKFNEFIKNNSLFNFDPLFFLLRRYNNEVSFEKLKRDIESGDSISLIEIRKTFINSLNCPVSIILTKEGTVNPVDFYIDTIKSYSDSRIEGIKLNSDGFINTSEFNVTAVINTGYLLSMIKNTTSHERYIHDIRVALWAAIIRDNMRMELTEKFALMTYLLTKIDFSCANELASQYNTYSDSKIKELQKSYHDSYEKEINCVTETCEDCECTDVNWFMNILTCRARDITPMNILSILEGTDSSIVDALNSCGLKVDRSSCFASSNKLLEVSNDSLLEQVRKYILINRIFPINFYDQFILKNGRKYNTFKEIDTIFEEYVHECVSTFQFTGDLARLNKIHNANDPFYDELRDSFKNPSRYSAGAITAFKALFTLKNDEQNVVDTTSDY